MNEYDPERRLWASVIIQALIDSSQQIESIERDQARAWFLASAGTTADNFNAVCLAAGFDPNQVRDFYKQNSIHLTRRQLSKLRNEMLKEEGDAD